MANGAELICQTAKARLRHPFEGTEGWVEFGYQGVKTSPGSLKTTKIGPNEIHLPVSNPQRQEDSSRNYIPTTCGTSSTVSRAARIRSRRSKSATARRRSATWPTSP